MSLMMMALYLSWAIALIWWDCRARRLPNWLTLPAGVAAGGWAIVQHPHALWGGVIYTALLLVTRMILRGVGMGDIKLSFPLGIVLASRGLVWVCVGAAMGSLFSVGVGIVMRLTGWGQGRGIPHGPGMLAGAGAAWCLSTLVG